MTTKPLEGLHAIAYARVSTDPKEDNGQQYGQDPAIQINLIRKWAKENGVILDKEVSEHASGGAWPRTALSDALISLITSPASILVCYDESRLTRKADEHLPLINDMIKDKGKTIRYVVYGDQDPDSLGVRMINAIKGVTNNEERAVLKRKTSDAMIYRRDVKHEHQGKPARLIITDDLEAEHFNAGYVNLDDDAKKIRTRVLKPSDVLAYARAGFTLNKVATRFLMVDASILHRAIDAYDTRHGGTLRADYFALLDEAKKVSQ